MLFKIITIIIIIIIIMTEKKLEYKSLDMEINECGT